MPNTDQRSKFYQRMGLLLLSLVIIGFGSSAVINNKNPFELPLLFHIHAVSYISWFVLFIYQASLINKANYNLHRRIGYSSFAVVIMMLISGYLIAAHSFAGGEGPIPIFTVEQFMLMPSLDLISISIFFSIAIYNKNNPITHKHAMLLMSIAIMDPAVARIAASVGFPPLLILLHISLVILVIVYDRKTLNKVNWVTWLCLGYVVARPVLIFTLGASDVWAHIANTIYG